MALSAHLAERSLADNLEELKGIDRERFVLFIASSEHSSRAFRTESSPWLAGTRLGS